MVFMTLIRFDISFNRTFMELKWEKFAKSVKDKQF